MALKTPKFKKIEIWADSFHEGEWCCDNLLKHYPKEKISNLKRKYVYGFVPQYRFLLDGKPIEITVYGSYKSWTPVPGPINELLKWGKPDFIAYDPEANKILFAVEETAAVPTGNQALQRCERMYGSARVNIPFFYLLPEYGIHIDGGNRRSSIWPSIMAIKLTEAYKTPSIVLHYADQENPESYSFGKGVNLLFSSISEMLANYLNGHELYKGVSFAQHYNGMLNFLESQQEQKRKIVNYLPGLEHIKESKGTIAEVLSEIAIGKPDVKLEQNILFWPTIDTLPEEEKQRQHAKELIKDDPLCKIFEEDVSNGYAYTLSNNAGSRPQKLASIRKWIDEQSKLAEDVVLDPPYTFNLKEQDFPPSKKEDIIAGEEDSDLDEYADEIPLPLCEEVEFLTDENFESPPCVPSEEEYDPDSQDEGEHRHITTSKNIIYLYDKWMNLKASIEKAYPRLKDRIPNHDEDTPVLVYISNSIAKGRIFGDPFTGQLAAFSIIFGGLGDIKDRIVLAYYPHQVHTQVLNRKKSNKGLIMMNELTDYLLFTGGALISVKDDKEVY